MISIIIPFYNSSEYLGRAIGSILNQSFLHWELILIDDGSTDDSARIIQPFLDNRKIKFFTQQNLGVSAARNLGVSESCSPWILFLDSDDELLPNSIKMLSNAIESDSEVSLWRGGFIRKTKKIEVIEIPTEKQPVAFLSGSFALKKQEFDKTGGYDTRLRFSENTELFHRLSLNNLKIGYLGSPLLLYNESQNGGSKNLVNMIDSLLLILTKHDRTLTNHIKYLYHQIIGVNSIRLRQFRQARKHLWKAYLYNPWKLDTLMRFLISCFPPLAKKIYTPEVNL